MCNIEKIKLINKPKDNCYKCNRLFSNFYEIMDTKSYKKIRFCKKCGNDLLKFIKNN